MISQLSAEPPPLAWCPTPPPAAIRLRSCGAEAAACHPDIMMGFLEGALKKCFCGREHCVQRVDGGGAWWGLWKGRWRRGGGMAGR